MDYEKLIPSGKVDLGRIYLESDSSSPNLEYLTVAVVENGKSTITPSEGYDGIAEVDLVVDVPSSGGVDWSQYGFDDTPEEITKMINSCENIINTWNPENTSLSFRNDKTVYMIPFINTSNIETIDCYASSNITQIADLDYKNITSFYRAFYGCTNLLKAPIINFDDIISNAVSCEQMFQNCTYLSKIPVYNLSKVSNVNNMFSNCKSLTDTDLDNILQSLITCTQQSTKTLYAVGFYGIVPVNKWYTLPHYQDFIDTGWIIGY